jgi:hypothetical protein
MSIWQTGGVSSNAIVVGRREGKIKWRMAAVTTCRHMAFSLKYESLWLVLGEMAVFHFGKRNEQEST